MEVHLKERYYYVGIKTTEEPKMSLLCGCSGDENSFASMFIYINGQWTAEGESIKNTNGIKAGFGHNRVHNFMVIIRDEDKYCDECQEIAHDHGIGTFKESDMARIYGMDKI